MASLSRDPNGNFTVQFVGGDRKRRSVRLGKVSKKTAEAVKLKVEHLVTAVVSKMPLDGDTAAWVASIGDDLAGKLAAVGLIAPRSSSTLGAFLDDYMAGRRTDGRTKLGTLSFLRQTVNALAAVLGRSTDMRQIGPAEAERVRRQFQEQGNAPTTVTRRLRTAKQIFKFAKRLKVVAENPFDELPSGGRPALDRRVYVPAADIERLIAESPPVWRIILALCRHAGLRCPSEVLSLRWDHVNFAANRLTVTSPKTEHLEGRAYRVAPIFAALRPHLEEAWELAGEGEEYVVGGPRGEAYREGSQTAHGWNGGNLRITLRRLIRRAGITPWPKLFINMRSSCETDLMQHHPIHVVTAWVGNTPRIALQHYLQTLDTDFDKAVRGGGAQSGAVVVQNPVQSPADHAGPEKTKATATPAFSGLPSPVVRPGPSPSGEPRDQCRNRNSRVLRIAQSTSSHAFRLSAPFAT